MLQWQRCPFGPAAAPTRQWARFARSTMAVMPSDDLATRIRTASRSCPEAVSGQVFRSPAQAFADLARSCAELGIEEWDVYGESGPVGRLE